MICVCPGKRYVFALGIAFVARLLSLSRDLAVQTAIECQQWRRLFNLIQPRPNCVLFDCADGMVQLNQLNSTVKSVSMFVILWRLVLFHLTEDL